MKTWFATFLCAGLFLSLDASADRYPERPVRWIVGFAPGGVTDSAARVFASGVSERLGQPIVIENRTGAAGVVAADFVAKSKPDGYTLFAADIGANAIVATLNKNLPYNPRADFTPVVLLGRMDLVIVVPTSLNVKTVAEFIRLAKSQPGKLNYATAGAGSLSHLGAELFIDAAGLKMIHVPYRGGGPAAPAVATGEAQLLVTTVPSARAMLDSGKLTAIAVASEKRCAELPDVPTLIEAGMPSVVAYSWIGVAGPAGLPADVVKRLSTEFNAAARDPKVIERMAKLGGEVIGGSPEAFAQYIDEEIKRWGKIIREKGISGD